MFKQSLSGVLLLHLFISSSVFAQDCLLDPFWADTLRCQLFPTNAQTPPAPASPPATVDEIKDYTRVDLPWDRGDGQPLRCVDGTQPVIFVDEAVNGPSDNWLITFQGGGSCFDADSCLLSYLSRSITRDPKRLENRELNEMTSAFEPAMKGWRGIHSAHPRNTFRDYNRVRIKKCGYDRFNGNATQQNVTGVVPIDADGDPAQAQGRLNSPASIDFSVTSPTVVEGSNLTIDLFHHGHGIVRHTLNTLRNGLTYTTWEAQGDEVATVERSLPPLKDAQKILFAGHSGGAHGLMHNIDRFVSIMSSWRNTTQAPFSADVRALFDAHFIPAVETEAAFVESIDGDLYDHHTICMDQVCKTNPPLHYSYDASAYFSYYGALKSIADQKYYDGPYPQWNVPLDASCLQAHPSETWKCADRFHVLFNHMTTPYFIRQDFTDPNGQHNDNPVGLENHGHRLMWADTAFTYCKDPASTTPCWPRLSPVEFRARVEEQGERLLRDFATRSELGILRNGVAMPSVHVWLADCGKHEGVFDSTAFFDDELVFNGTGQSLHQAVARFMGSSPTDRYVGYIDGKNGVESDCL